MDDSIRVSDADRDRVTQLRDHFAAGRITPGELDERLSAALNATPVAARASTATQLCVSQTTWPATQHGCVTERTRHDRQYRGLLRHPHTWESAGQWRDMA